MSVVTNGKCDKWRKKRPFLCGGDWYEISCDCGKVFRRCMNHEGVIGAGRSRRAHRTLGCPAYEKRIFPTVAPTKETP